jgi:hypothetical protein
VRGYFKAVCALIFLLSAARLVAQSADCPASVQSAFAAARKACASMEINEICYGSGTLKTTFRSSGASFKEAGDTAKLGALKSVEASPFDAHIGDYSVAVMRPRANLPDNALTLIAFGDVQLQNASDKSSDFIALPVLAKTPEGVNVRAAPKPDAAVVARLLVGQTANAVARLKDGSWILLTDGWASAEVLKSAADLSLLEIAPPDTNPPGDWLYGPMQAFTLRTEIDDAPCAQASDSGALAQTPDGAGEIALMVNGIPLAFEGTIYLQGSPTGETAVSILEGQARYGDNPHEYSAGARLQLGLDSNKAPKLLAIPDDYHYSRARHLPLTLLPHQFDLPFSLGGLTKPFTPGGFLTTVGANDPCVIAWNVAVNVRAGPGTEYPLRQGVPANYYAHPDARATASDGVLWWRLAEGIWIRSGIVTPAGACLNLPKAEIPPLEKK